MHRVRVGLMGLGSVFLLVMLAAAVLRMSGGAAAADNASLNIENGATPNEPLAQLGVAPGNPQPDVPENAASTAARVPASAAHSGPPHR